MSSPPIPPTPSPATDAPIAPRALLLSALAGVVYLLVAGNYRFDFRQTQYAHHILIADAMLHGQLHVREEIVRRMIDEGTRAGEAYIRAELQRTGAHLTPEEWRATVAQYLQYRVLYDWSPVGEKLYGYWGPLGPVAMIPFVAVFGTGARDTLIDALLGALNVGLFYWFLRRVERTGLARFGESCCVGLTVLLAFGSVHFYLASTGRVWFAVQIVTLTAMLGACIAIVSRSTGIVQYAVAGAFFGAAILGRNVAVLLGLFFAGVIWLRTRDSAERRKEFVVRLLAFSAPVAIAIGLQALYNYERFGSIREDGVAIQLKGSADPTFIAEFAEYGLFSPHYLARNAKYYLWNTALPLDPSGSGRRIFDLYGNSMFLVTPPLLYLFLAWRRRSPLALAAAAGVLPLFVALLFFLGSGYMQFGSRYLLEAMPLLLLLVGEGMGGRIDGVAYALIVLAIAANAFGAYIWSCWSDCSAIEPYIAVWTLPAFIAIAVVARLAYLFWARRGRGMFV